MDARSRKSIGGDGGDGGDGATDPAGEIENLFFQFMLGPGGGGDNSSKNKNKNNSAPADIYGYRDGSPDTVENKPKTTDDTWLGASERRRERRRSITRGGLVDSSEMVRNTLGFEYINEEEPTDASPEIAPSPSRRGFEAVDLLDTDKSAFQLGDPIHDSNTSIGRFRNQLGAFINNRWVQKLSTTLIILNAIVLGALTFLYDQPTATLVLERIDFLLLVLFTVEVAVQLVYLGIIEFGKNCWLLFDILVIGLSWIFLDSQFSIFRSFRIFRVFALVSRWSSLKRLFKAVGMTMPKMATIAFALLLFFYVFGVMYTSMYHNLWEEGYLDYNYFGRLDYTFLTLFQMMTLDSWTDVVRQVMEKYPFCWLGFMCWVIITAFFVFNLIIAVICESLIELQNIADESEKNQLIDNQKRMMERHRKEIDEQSRQVLSLQSQTLANQVAIGATLVDIMEHLKDSHNYNYNYNYNYRPYSAPQPPRAAPSSAPASSWCPGTEFGSKDDLYHCDNMDTTTSPTMMMAGSGDDDNEEEMLLFVEDEESPPVQKRQDPQSRQLPHPKPAPAPPGPLSPSLKEITSSLQGHWSNKTKSKQQEQKTKNGPSSLDVDELDCKADNNNAVGREEKSLRLLECFDASERSRVSPSVGNIHSQPPPPHHQGNNNSVKQMLEASASEFAYWRSNLINNNSWPGMERSREGGGSSTRKNPPKKSNSYNSKNSNIASTSSSPSSFGNRTGSFSGRDNNDDTEVASFSVMRATNNSHNNECVNNGSTMSILNEDDNDHEEEESMQQQDDDSRDVAVVDDNDNNGNKRGRPSSSSLSTIQPSNTEASISSSPAVAASLVAPSQQQQQQPSTDGLSEIAPLEGYTSRSPSSKQKLKSSEFAAAAAADDDDDDDVRPSSSKKPTSSPSQSPSIENVDPSKHKSPSSPAPSSTVEPSNSVPSLHVQVTDTVSPSPSDASIGHTPPRSSISPPPSPSQTSTSTTTTTTTTSFLYKQTTRIQQEKENEVVVLC